MAIKFRFQDLRIWQSAIEIADELFDIADDLEKKLADLSVLCRQITSFQKSLK